MNRQMFIILIWPTLAKAMEDKGFTPRLWLPENESIVYVEMNCHGYDSDYIFEFEKEFHDAVIDLLIQYHIPFVDKSHGYTFIKIDLTKLNLQEINND